MDLSPEVQMVVFEISWAFWKCRLQSHDGGLVNWYSRHCFETSKNHLDLTVQLFGPSMLDLAWLQLNPDLKFRLELL